LKWETASSSCWNAGILFDLLQCPFNLVEARCDVKHLDMTEGIEKGKLLIKLLEYFFDHHLMDLEGYYNLFQKSCNANMPCAEDLKLKSEFS
jgi:hypothetical protein